MYKNIPIYEVDFMKKFICLLLALTVLLCTSCGDDTVDTSKEQTQSAEVSENTTSESDVITVPDIDGMNREEAEAALKAAGFEVKVKEKNNDEVPAGQISGLDREVGSTANRGDRIWLYVSTGKSATALALEPKLPEIVTSRPKLDVGGNSDYKPLNYEFMKAFWLSQYDMDGIFENGGMQIEQEKFAEIMDKLFSAIRDRGFNTAIVQLRPNGDSFYPSAYYPPSKYAVGFYGGEFVYDPLTIMIDAAHKYGISFHAWINPLRCMEATDMSLINVAYGVRDYEQNHLGDYIIKHTDNRLYLNPGYEEVRQLIINGATEIVRYYDVDGVHMDDYFYPTQDVSFDNIAYLSQTEYKDRNQFRFASVNKLVKGLYDGVKAENKDVIFGISPAGNVGYTRDLYADVDTWLSEEGYVDYIMPQLYWGLQNRYSPFGTMYSQWKALIKVDSIKLIIGMTLANAVEGYNGEGSAEWINNRDILKKCLSYALNAQKCDGFSLFSAADILAISTTEPNIATQEELTNLFELASGF